MNQKPLQSRTLAVIAVIVPLLVLLVYVALRSGPLAPVAVTVATVKSRPIAPALFGIGTVQARYIYKIGPTFTGRVKRLDVHVGDTVEAGQVLGEMDPVDLDERIHAQEATIKRAAAGLREAKIKHVFAKTQARRYEQLLTARSTSEETVATKRQEQQVADAALSAAREDLSRSRADLAALRAQRDDLVLVAPDVDPGTTVVAGQAVVELIDPQSLWIDTRFDQISAAGLAASLPAKIVLRSRKTRTLTGRVLRVEPLADAVTEETLAKIVFDPLPKSLPPVGELAEVTVMLPALPTSPTIPDAAIHRIDGKVGVWQLRDEDLHFTSVILGASDLQGNVQVRQGLGAGDKVVVYSEKALSAHSRIHVVERIPGVSS